MMCEITRYCNWKEKQWTSIFIICIKICHKQYSRTAIIYIWSNDQNKQCRRIKDQNKLHVISIISVGRILSPISNTCKSLKSGTHVLIKTTTTKNDKNTCIPFYFYGHWLKKSIHGWNIKLILILKSWKIYSPCPQDRFISKYCIYTLVCIRNEVFFHSITVRSSPQRKLGCELHLPLRGPLALNGEECQACRPEFYTVHSLCAFASSLYGK